MIATGTIRPGVFAKVAIPVFLIATGFRIERAEQRQQLARQRLSAGLCPACDYDLQATSDRRPECGRLKGE